MQVTKIGDGAASAAAAVRPTNKELQNEFNYILAEQLTKKLLDTGMISQEEYRKIMEKNGGSFSTLMLRLHP